MIIADSAVQLFSSRTAIQQYTKRESLTVWQGNQEPRAVQAETEKGRELDHKKQLARLKDLVDITEGRGRKVRHSRPADVELTEEQELQKDLNMRLLKELFERLTGRKFHLIDPAALTAAQAEPEPAAVPAEGAELEPAAESAGFGLIYDYHESRYEFEKTEFSAGGTITTADGQRIDFSIALSMSREFYSEENLSIRAGDALKDPLVINFAGTAAQLTQRDFSFDIDSDGTRDQIAFVGPGSGFLALDRNGDGVVNNGSELFGTASGDGFGDLSGYDKDGNGWIDENDAVYEGLRIWTRSADGSTQLLGLGQAGIGALYLGHIETLFSVKDPDESLLGQVRSTGLALLENGRAVTMQQLDLAA